MEEILYYASYILETIFETYVIARLECSWITSQDGESI